MKTPLLISVESIVLVTVAYTSTTDLGNFVSREAFIFPTHVLAREKLVEVSKLDDQEKIEVVLMEMDAEDLLRHCYYSRGSCKQVLNSQRDHFMGWDR